MWWAGAVENGKVRLRLFKSLTVETVEDLETLLVDFEKIISESLPYHMSGSPIARAIREIYATRAAFALL